MFEINAEYIRVYLFKAIPKKHNFSQYSNSCHCIIFPLSLGHYDFSTRDGVVILLQSLILGGDWLLKTHMIKTLPRKRIFKYIEN